MRLIRQFFIGASCCCWLFSFTGYAQSPANLLTDIPWDENAALAGVQEGFSGIAAIEAAFTNARRQEEIQLGLSINSLGNLTLPATWATYTPNQKALVLHNLERIARAGQTYANGTAQGLGFEAVDAGLTTISQNHATYLKTNNLFTHTGAGGTTSFARIQAVYPRTPAGVACSEFLARGENIAIFGNSGNAPNPLIIERAIYLWIYADAGSAWGHREASLLQDKDLTNNSSLYGFKNNYGSALTEGFIGIGTASATDGSYPYFGPGFPSVDVVVLNIMDPVPTAAASANSCAYNLSAPLPVRLVSFGATLTESNQVRLEWETAQEVNSSHFIIERSRDLAQVENVGLVESHGSTARPARYTTLDQNPLIGHSYYRLREIGKNGEESRFGWTPVRWIPADFVVVYPNPVASSAPIHLSLKADGQPRIKLTSSLGVPLAINLAQSGNNWTIYPQARLVTGVYQLTIEQQGQAVVRSVVVR